MGAKPKHALEFESEWVREYARDYRPSEVAFEFAPSLLRRAGIDLVQIRNAFRDGWVVFADKLDGPGALWIVDGDDGDGRILRLTLVVETQIMRVRLRDVEEA